MIKKKKKLNVFCTRTTKLKLDDIRQLADTRLHRIQVLEAQLKQTISQMRKSTNKGLDVIEEMSDSGMSDLSLLGSELGDICNFY